MTSVDFYEEDVLLLRYRLWLLGQDYKGTKNVLIQRLVSTKLRNQVPKETTGENAILGKKQSGEKTCVGRLLHNSVWITQREHMLELCSTLSGFGKGSLSRSVPVFGTDAPEASRGKAARQRAKVVKKRQSLETQDNLEGAPHSFLCTAAESLAVDISKLLCHPAVDNLLEEHLQLCLWEAFYASFIANQLRIFDKNNDALSEWTDPDYTYAYFCKLLPLFPYYLAVYYYYRQKGWSPHSGLKYGVDFVLYSYGSSDSHHHSPFCVLIRVHEQASGEKCLLEKSWISMQNRLRLVKQVAKQLLLVHVVKPMWLTDELLYSQWKSCLSLEISELLVERWTALNKRRKTDESTKA
ncbi:hypothetical protein GAYE_PCTG14G0555 [Galdieria yellowstonensis]|uniref:tRNA-intron lyase n=1 Tax=Galdieria yellowstonensis TaxID=3028027 RepID=A0AAV9I7W1_9RHOD|nr:hypothetical protein GAYE_PCTG14G0555 [Galdieria yellowstonensis]